MSNTFARIQFIAMILMFAILSWLLIHVFSILGIFLALAYPMWWFFAPRQTVCLFCRSRKEGETCIFCHRKITKSDGNAPKTFFSSILNGGVILAFSVVSVGIVFMEAELLHSFGFPPAAATAGFALPATSQHTVGEIFPMKLEVNGITTPINTVQADISFDPNKLEIVNISTVDSFANIFIQREIDNTKGFARLSGGLPNPGFSGSHGVFGTVYFKAKEVGSVSVKFLPSTQVLANDGSGDNVLKEYGAISYVITAPTPGIGQANSPSINVLGASTSSTPTQMIFYDEKDVLGATTSTVVTNRPQQPTFLSRVLSVLGQVDNLILSFWKHL